MIAGVNELTQLLRESEAPLWRGLRDELGARGLSPLALSEERAARTRWFESYVETLDHGSVLASGSPPYACPCCHCLTLSARGIFDICSVCFWEDDHDADVVRGGPNGRLSLTQARENYAHFGACDERSLPHVRRPLPSERPPS